jgi:hypothetical protein
MPFLHEVERVARVASGPSEQAWPPLRQPAIHPSQRACCCPTQATYRALLPATGEAGETALLLCGQHLGETRRALAAVRAVGYDVTGRLAPPLVASDPVD